MNETSTVEILAVHGLGRELLAEGAPAEQMARYREWRDRVLAAADVSVAA